MFINKVKIPLSIFPTAKAAHWKPEVLKRQALEPTWQENQHGHLIQIQNPGLIRIRIAQSGAWGAAFSQVPR